MKKIWLSFLSLPMALLGQGQQALPLYPGAIPNSKPGPDREISQTIDNGKVLIISKVSRPTLTVYLPDPKKATGAAIVVIPGGGYQIVAAGHEGSEVAKAFADMGIAAFVLKYRIPDDSTMVNKEIGPLMDAQQAILTVRQHAKKWGVIPSKVGVIGFSAGGHLASTLSTHYKKSLVKNPNGITLRPDFQILVYPVISFSDSIGHIGSRDNLLGKHPSEEKIREYSAELQVDAHTPPTFLVHARDDDAVKVNNSEDYLSALNGHGIPGSIYLFEKGGHGFGLINPTSSVRWMDRIGPWLKSVRIL